MNRLIILTMLTLAGCANLVQESEQKIREGQIKEGLAQLEEATRNEPKNIDYRMAFYRNRDAATGNMLLRADGLREAGRLDEAEALYKDVLALDAENLRARDGMNVVASARRQEELVSEAMRLIKENKPEEARYKLRIVLAQNPSHARARDAYQELENKSHRQGLLTPDLFASYQKPVSLEFRETPLSVIFNALAQQTRLNFLFDKEVRTDQRTTILMRNVAMKDAVNLLLVTNRLGMKVLNGNTVLVYPNQPDKLKDYQELAVKNFYLVSADAKVVMNLIKTMLKTRDLFVDEKLNLLVMRDTPESIRIAEKMISALDRAEPEVMLDVEVLEVKRTRLMELGMLYPSLVTAGLIPAAGGENLVATDFHGISARDISIGALSLKANLLKTDGDVNLLANPRIRVKNRGKAKIHIGDRVPVITTTSSPNIGVSESVSYLDVGLKLDVEPNIYLDDEVGINVSMEVSNIVDTFTSTETGTRTYQVGTRNASTMLRIKNGETQVLAGLINDEDRKTANKIPGLGDLPLLGRLFSNHRDDRSKTEIMLLITPRIVRNLQHPEPGVSEFMSGTESAVGMPSLQLSVAGQDGAPATEQAAPVFGLRPQTPLPSPPAQAYPASQPDVATPLPMPPAVPEIRP